jgi:mercuric ion transport protein
VAAATRMAWLPNRAAPPSNSKQSQKAEQRTRGKRLLQHFWTRSKQPWIGLPEAAGALRQSRQKSPGSLPRASVRRNRLKFNKMRKRLEECTTHSCAWRGRAVTRGGGLAAAFGAASCCALPTLLGSLVLGTAWLVTIAWFAAPHPIALLAIAIICLASGSGVLLWRRRRLAACAPGAACRSPVSAAVLAFVLSLGAALVVLGFMFA